MKTSRCCRHHNLVCPIQIEPGETKHGLWNHRYHTVSRAEFSLANNPFFSAEKTSKSSGVPTNQLLPGDALLLRRSVPILLEDGRQPSLLHRWQLLLQRWKHEMLRLQDGGGKKLELHMFLAFTHLHLQILTFLLLGVREAKLVGRLPEEGSAGQSCLEAACGLLDHSRERLEGVSRLLDDSREHLEGACRLLDHTLRWTVASFAESFRESVDTIGGSQSPTRSF